MARVVVISDTHLQHDRLSLPEGDLLIHAGDFTSQGTAREVSRFVTWLDKQPHPNKVIIAGNHEFCAETVPRIFRGLLSPGIHYLRDSGITLCGLSIWGSPYTPIFCDWAFNAGPETIEKSWRKIPKNLDVLITHGPPHGILDLVLRGENVGCPILREAVRKKKPRYHLFGHIHEGRGQHFEDGTLFINASSLDGHYRGPFDPIVLDIEPGAISSSP